MEHTFAKVIRGDWRAVPRLKDSPRYSGADVVSQSFRETGINVDIPSLTRSTDTFVNVFAFDHEATPLAGGAEFAELDLGVLPVVKC